MTAILVTGGAGYVGAHAAKALAKAGYIPVTFDNLSRGHAWAVKWGPLVQAELSDAAALDDAFARYQPEAVMHFAAYTFVGESVSDPLLYYRNNVLGTLSLLEAMQRAKCQRIVFSSTCATYGVPENVPIAEDCPQNPVNPYGETKLVIERVLRNLDAAGKLRFIALRYFNAAGNDPAAEIGEAHDPETHLIPLVLEAAKTGKPIKVFGDDYDTPDGSCVRDYIHVDDLADAHLAALDWLKAGKPSRAFNLGNGQGFSVFDVIKAARAVTGRDIQYELAPRRAGDSPVLIADATRAKQDLGWTPNYPDIAVQIEHAWRFLKDRP